MKRPVIRFWMALLAFCSVVPFARAQSDDGTADYSDSFWSEPESGLRFGADALMWHRNNKASGGPVIGGTESLNMRGLNYDAAGGFRLSASWLIDPNYEVEGIWTQFADWNASRTGVLTRAVSFDGGQGSVIVDPTGNANYVNKTTMFRSLFDAATDPLGGALDPNNETTEFEFLKPGSTYLLRQTSQINDGQVNFKTRRASDERFTFGLGYRYVRLDETALSAVSGTFDAIDTDGDEVGNNSPNDALSDAAFQAHGFNAGPGFSDNGGLGSSMTLLSNGTANNRLHGLQGLMETTIFDEGRVRLDILSRMGLFLNQVSGSVSERYLNDTGTGYTRTFEDQKDKLAFGLNLGFNLSIRLAERARFRTGYEAMYLNNVALGASQQQALVYNSLGDASYSVRANDSILLHGLKVGLELDW